MLKTIFIYAFQIKIIRTLSAWPKIHETNFLAPKGFIAVIPTAYTISDSDSVGINLSYRIKIREISKIIEIFVEMFSVF